MTLPRSAAVAFGRVPLFLSSLAIIAFFVGLVAAAGQFQIPAVLQKPFLLGLFCCGGALVTGGLRLRFRRYGYGWGPMGFFVFAAIVSLGWPAAHYYLHTNPATVVVSQVGTDAHGLVVLVTDRNGEELGRLFGWRVETLSVGDTVTAWVDPTGWVEPLRFPLLGPYALAVTVAFGLALLSLLTLATEILLEHRAYRRREAARAARVATSRLFYSGSRFGGGGGYSSSDFDGYDDGGGGFGGYGDGGGGFDGGGGG